MNNWIYHNNTADLNACVYAYHTMYWVFSEHLTKRRPTLQRFYGIQNTCVANCTFVLQHWCNIFRDILEVFIPCPCRAHALTICTAETFINYWTNLWLVPATRVHKIRRYAVPGINWIAKHYYFFHKNRYLTNKILNTDTMHFNIKHSLGTYILVKNRISTQK